MKTIKKVVLGLAVVSLLQSCSYNFMENLLGEDRINKKEKTKEEINAKEVNNSDSESTSFNS